MPNPGKPFTGKMAKKTPNDAAEFINWIRDLHWQVLRLSSEYRSDYEDLKSWLSKKAERRWSRLSSADAWAQRRDAKEGLVCLELFELLSASGPVIQPPPSIRRAISEEDYLSDYFLGRLSALFPGSGLRNELQNEKSIFLGLVEATRKAMFPSLGAAKKFCRKWDLRCPLPPCVEVPLDVDLFTGPYAQPIREHKIEEQAGVVKMLVFTGLGREITLAFVVGFIHHFLPKGRHWTDIFKSPDLAVVEFESTEQFESIVEKTGLFGRVVKKKGAPGSVSVRKVKKDSMGHLRIRVELPIDKKILRKELSPWLPKFSLRRALKQKDAKAEWETILKVRHLRLEGRTWEKIGIKLSPAEILGGDPIDWARYRGRRYTYFHNLFFPRHSLKLSL